MDRIASHASKREDTLTFFSEVSMESREAPVLSGVPFFNLFEAWHDPLGLFMRSQRAYGDVARFRAGSFWFYFVNDVTAIHHILVDNAKNYTKSRNYRGLKLFMGEGLVTSEGDHWRRQRKLAQPAFHRERLASFADVMAKDTVAMLDRWATEPARIVDVHEEMMRLTLRIVGRTLFGCDVDGDAKEVGKALTFGLHFTNDYVESLLPLPLWVPTPKNLRFSRAKETLDKLVYRIIDERRNGEKKDDLLGMLMEATDEETGRGMSNKQLRDEVITLVVAGHETTATALTWTWYLLSRHPEVERPVQAEVATVLGGRAVVFEDVAKLVYTRMVVEEAMRLYPPVWIFERQAIADDVVAGFRLPKGAIVGISPYALHRHPAHWSNPEGFDPERFTAERSEGRPRFAYLPFGGGPRQCIGNGFAMMETVILLATIASRARLELVPGHPAVPDPLVTLRPKHGMRMSVRWRPATQSTSLPAGKTRPPAQASQTM
jgi:cytochrome P450